MYGLHVMMYDVVVDTYVVHVDYKHNWDHHNHDVMMVVDDRVVVNVVHLLMHGYMMVVLYDDQVLVGYVVCVANLSSHV